MLKPIIRMLAFATCIFYPGLANGGILTAEGSERGGYRFFQNADVSRLADVGSLELVYVEKSTLLLVTTSSMLQTKKALLLYRPMIPHCR